MSSRYSIERDLDELERMVESLRDYVLSDALYMPIGGGFFRAASMPQLTLGNLLLRRRRLSILRSSLSSAMEPRLDAALRQHDTVQGEWTVHYEKKLQQETPSRLKLMAAFFRDCGDNPRGCDAAYPVEAQRRTVVQEILLAMDAFGYDRGDLAAQVHSADVALRGLLHAGSFIWSAELETVYASETFWWLYGRPAGA